MNDNTEILILEDSKTQAAELTYILEKNNYNVRHSLSAEDAISLLKSYRPDIIISDIIMPGMNGFDFCSIVKSDDMTKTIPVVLLTSLSDPDDIIKGMACGADSFITKPYNEDFLLSKIQYLLTNFEFRKGKSDKESIEILFKREQTFN